MRLDRSGNTGYHCSTEQSAKAFIKECYNKGIKWRTKKYLTIEDTCWDYYQENTCYVVQNNVVSYGHIDYLKEYDVKIIEYKEGGDFEMKTKQEQIEEAIRLQSIVKSEPIVVWDFSNIEGPYVCLFEQTDKGIILSQRSFRNTGIVTIQGYRKASDIIDEFVERFINAVTISYQSSTNKDYYEITVDKFNKIVAEMRKEKNND